jgi:hypothetical protein
MGSCGALARSDPCSVAPWYATPEYARATAAVTMQGQTIRTPEKELALIVALHERPSYLSACRKAKISRAAFYEWKQNDPDFAARIDAARNVGLDALEDALITRGLKNDTTAAIFMLKSHRREIYGDRLNLEIQLRQKAERMAAALNVPVDELVDVAGSIAGEAWDRWP